MVEGDDIANDSATTAIRLANYVQLMDKVAQVSSTNEAVSSAGDVTKMVKQILYKTQELEARHGDPPVLRQRSGGRQLVDRA